MTCWYFFLVLDIGHSMFTPNITYHIITFDCDVFCSSSSQVTVCKANDKNSECSSESGGVIGILPIPTDVEPLHSNMTTLFTASIAPQLRLTVVNVHCSVLSSTSSMPSSRSTQFSKLYARYQSAKRRSRMRNLPSSLTVETLILGEIRLINWDLDPI